jgi:hypothetical protein
MAHATREEHSESNTLHTYPRKDVNSLISKPGGQARRDYTISEAMRLDKNEDEDMFFYKQLQVRRIRYEWIDLISSLQNTVQNLCKEHLDLNRTFGSQDRPAVSKVKDQVS